MNTVNELLDSGKYSFVIGKGAEELVSGLDNAFNVSEIKSDFDRLYHWIAVFASILETGNVDTVYLTGRTELAIIEHLMKVSKLYPEKKTINLFVPKKTSSDIVRSLFRAFEMLESTPQVPIHLRIFLEQKPLYFENSEQTLANRTIYLDKL